MFAIHYIFLKYIKHFSLLLTYMFKTLPKHFYFFFEKNYNTIKYFYYYNKVLTITMSIGQHGLHSGSKK